MGIQNVGVHIFHFVLLLLTPLPILILQNHMIEVDVLHLIRRVFYQFDIHVEYIDHATVGESCRPGQRCLRECGRERHIHGKPNKVSEHYANSLPVVGGD